MNDCDGPAGQPDQPHVIPSSVKEIEVETRDDAASESHPLLEFRQG
jgi:hypothetical protein